VDVHPRRIVHPGPDQIDHQEVLRLTQFESLAVEALNQFRETHDSGWIGAEQFGNLIAIGALDHTLSRLWGDRSQLARDLAERMRRGGLVPLGFAWERTDWAMVCDQPPDPVPLGAIVGQIQDVVRVRSHEQFGRPLGPVEGVTPTPRRERKKRKLLTDRL
jgi:hypothetical protein